MRTLIDKIQQWLDTLTDAQKRLLLAASLLVAALVIGFIIFWVFFRPLFIEEEQKININGQLVNVSQLPDLINAGDFEIIEENINAVLPTVDDVAKGGNTLAQVIYEGDAQNTAVGTDGDTVQYYDPATGQFYRIDANGNVTLLDEKIFKGVNNVTWSNDSDKAVLELDDGFNVVYDFTADKQYTLHEDMEEFDFAPNNNQISFKFTPVNEEDRWVGVSNIDGSGALGIEPLGDNEELLNAQWSPSGQAIGALHEYIDGQSQRVVPIGFKGENFKQFIVNGRGFDYRWTQDGHKMIYSVYSAETNYNYTLHVVDAIGDDIGKNNQSLDLATSVDKCTFTATGNSVYCAVPVNPPLGGAIADTALTAVQHDIYKVDLTTGQKTKIATPVDPFGETVVPGPSDLIVSADESVLYYREATTGQLRRILLK